jgi:hypothetical protein
MDYAIFSQAVIEKLRYYVYLLIDPANDEIFYVGKGIGPRTFDHVNEADTEITEKAKLERIRAIHKRGQKVKHVIHRHGLTEKEAFEIEAALIDFIELVGLPELTNLVSGHHSWDRGLMPIEEIINRYDAQKIDIQEPSILVNITQSYHPPMNEDKLYEVTRGGTGVSAHDERKQSMSLPLLMALCARSTRSNAGIQPRHLTASPKPGNAGVLMGTSQRICTTMLVEM